MGHCDFQAFSIRNSIVNTENLSVTGEKFIIIFYDFRFITFSKTEFKGQTTIRNSCTFLNFLFNKQTYCNACSAAQKLSNDRRKSFD